MKVKLWLLRLQFWFIKDCNTPAGRWPWMWIHIWSNLSDMTRFCRKCKVLQIDPLWFLECLSAVYHRKQYKTLDTGSNLDIGLVLSMHLHVNTYRSNRNYSATSAGEKKLFLASGNGRVVTIFIGGRMIVAILRLLDVNLISFRKGA